MDIIKRMGRRTVMWSIVGLASAMTVVTLARAVNSDNNNSSSSSTASSSSDTESSAEVKLTSDEIDKIIQDLKVTTNIDNVIEKLDEIIKRAELLGNSSLKEYAEKTKELYQLQSQINELSTTIEAMKKKNSDINALDGELKDVLSVTTILEDLNGAVSNEVLLVLETLPEETFTKLNDVIAEIENLVDLTDVESLTLNQRCLLDILLLNEVFNQNVLEGDRLEVAKEAYSVAVTVLKSYEKQKYSESDYNELVEYSERFADMGKKAEIVYPEQVVMFDGAFPLRYAPIMYDGHILISLDDLYQYIDATIEYMYNNATMVIQSKDKIVELTAGKNVAYVNDEPKNIAVPVLNVNERMYVSGEFFAEVYGISYRYIQEHQTLVMYKNLNQLENPAIPNEINRD